MHEDMTIIIESNEDLKKQLQTQRSLGKRRSIENEDLKFNIKEKDEKIAGKILCLYMIINYLQLLKMI